jgi:hypothetical protein
MLEEGNDQTVMSILSDDEADVVFRTGDPVVDDVEKALAEGKEVDIAKAFFGDDAAAVMAAASRAEQKARFVSFQEVQPAVPTKSPEIVRLT